MQLFYHRQMAASICRYLPNFSEQANSRWSLGLNLKPKSPPNPAPRIGLSKPAVS